MKKLTALVLTLMLTLLSGCASVPMASLEQDTQAKDFSPIPNKAALYIYRNEMFGAAIPMSVSVNGRVLGQTAARTYFRLNLPPGRYSVESHAENVSALQLNTEPGKNYFVWQEVKMGMWMARSQLQQTDETVGRAGVMESKLIAAGIAESEFQPLDARPAGAAASPPGNDPAAQKLRELQNLRKDGVITEEEYQQKRRQLLENL